MKELLNKRLITAKTDNQRQFLEKAKATEGAVLLTASEPDFGISDGVRIHLSKSTSSTARPITSLRREISLSARPS